MNEDVGHKHLITVSKNNAVINEISVFNVDAADQHSTVEAVIEAANLSAKQSGCTGVAVHRSLDGVRVLSFSQWETEAHIKNALQNVQIRKQHEQSRRIAGKSETGLYTVIHTDNPEIQGGTAISTEYKGAVVIDVLAFPRLLRVVVEWFTLSNGRQFALQPGHRSASVMRGREGGRIATYARWESESAFFDAFGKVAGTSVTSMKELNDAASRKTFGLIRPDYHAYEVVMIVQGTAE